MMVNRHKYFRWTGRTARITFAYMVAFPAFMGYLAYTYDVSGDLGTGNWNDGADSRRVNGICEESGGAIRSLNFRLSWRSFGWVAVVHTMRNAISKSNPMYEEVVM